jgi:hypothetical protein
VAAARESRAAAAEVCSVEHLLFPMKRPFNIIVFLALLIFAVGGTSFASELKVAVRVNGELSGEILLQIEGGFAKAKVGDETEEFNLKDLCWLEPSSSKWVTLDQCKTWAEQSKAKSLASVATVPASIQAFMQWSLNPAFEVERRDNTLRLSSGQVDYLVEGQASKNAVTEFFRYATLNAYKKAMSERKLPPFAELKAISEKYAAFSSRQSRCL